MIGAETMHAPRMSALAIGLLLAGGAAVAQEVTFTLDADIPGCTAGEHVFGWLDASSAGIDPADMPEPPPPLGLYLAAAFRLPGVAEPDRWRRDLRATSDFVEDGRETWDLVLSTTGAQAVCNLTFAPGIGDPAGYRLLLGGACRDTLSVPGTVAFTLSGAAQLNIEVLRVGLSHETMTWGAAKRAYEADR